MKSTLIGIHGEDLGGGHQREGTGKRVGRTILNWKDIT